MRLCSTFIHGIWMFNFEHKPRSKASPATSPTVAHRISRAFPLPASRARESRTLASATVSSVRLALGHLIKRSAPVPMLPVFAAGGDEVGHGDAEVALANEAAAADAAAVGVESLPSVSRMLRSASGEGMGC
jgi:hypothetical protein